MDRVLGVRHRQVEGPGEEIDELLGLRTKARDAKDWAESDRIRDELACLGWEVRDTPQGQVVKKRG